eukprot:TRINITY_DN4682_c0_g1_i1.p1 TRINITY_DN4682_c0_g1~~TRINITY_DN4682_c0_g1_i1.p1  ORF type:complete len:173 (-),score=20.58 TRINITY_DN4682_c0_g1_i1:536-1054(-)
MPHSLIQQMCFWVLQNGFDIAQHPRTLSAIQESMVHGQRQGKLLLSNNVTGDVINGGLDPYCPDSDEQWHSSERAKRHVGAVQPKHADRRYIDGSKRKGLHSQCRNRDANAAKPAAEQNDRLQQKCWQPAQSRFLLVVGFVLACTQGFCCLLQFGSDFRQAALVSTCQLCQP